MNINENFRGIGRIGRALSGFLYDFRRYVLFAGWSKNLKNKDIRNYHSVKIYHALEKSMSFPNRNANSGWANANLLLDCCLAAQKAGNIGFHDRAAISVLRQFVNLEENAGRPEASAIRQALEKLYAANDVPTGVTVIKNHTFGKGRLDDPESFFNSRYSLRDFSDAKVPMEVVERATTLAMKAPSACNRQPWAIYYTNDPELRDSALKYQSGNRGFGHKVPMLLVIASDLRAFMPGQERYQHWIDGGIFSMSLILSLHSLGLGSCCLNWSQSAPQDKAFRSVFGIADQHTIIMMLAVGWPKEDNTVCVSGRRPIDEVLLPLKSEQND